MGPALKKGTAPTLVEADGWFKDTIIPKRGTSAGFSLNRLWKTPRDTVKGNTEDPDGLCGDAALFVFEQFFRDFGGYTTSDGYNIGLVLWEGKILNHMANVMLARTKTAVQKYSLGGKRKLECVSGNGQYSITELFSLHAYDLYYKKSSSLEKWWQDRDSSFGGTIKLGFPYNIDD